MRGRLQLSSLDGATRQIRRNRLHRPARSVHPGTSFRQITSCSATLWCRIIVDAIEQMEPQLPLPRVNLRKSAGDATRLNASVVAARSATRGALSPIARHRLRGSHEPASDGILRRGARQRSGAPAELLFTFRRSLGGNGLARKRNTRRRSRPLRGAAAKRLQGRRPGKGPPARRQRSAGSG